MRTNDQYFEPGDKVMRVSDCPRPEQAVIPPHGAPKYGLIYCVEDFWEGPQFNVVMLVGFGGWVYENGMKCGWAATAFRKIEEIKLCVSAFEHMTTPIEANGPDQTPRP